MEEQEFTPSSTELDHFISGMTLEDLEAELESWQFDRFVGEGL